MKETVRNAREDAVVSHTRDIRVLERYLSDKFLNDSIQGALDKGYEKRLREGIDIFINSMEQI